MKIGLLGDIYLASQTAVPRVSAELRELMSSCDHVVANVEAPITEAERPIAKTGPVMKHSRATLDLLERVNVDVAGLANNHVGDHGTQGLKDTLDTLRAAALNYGGAGLSFDEVYRPVRLASGEVTVSLLFGGENGFGCVSDDRREQSGYAWMFHPTFLNLLRQEADCCDFVIVVAHGGVEHMDRPLPQWRSAYRHFVDLGAAAVVAHHPHLTQGYEVYRQAPIFFSIGNFYFNTVGPQRYWYHSQIPLLELKSDRTVRVEVAHARFELDNGGRVVLDDTDASLPRTERLSAELGSPEYADLVAADLLELWRTRYGPTMDVCPSPLASLSSLRHFVGRTLRCCLQGTSFRHPIELEALVDIESHRWAVSETMRVLRQPDNAGAPR